jgi:hypothetical protein
MHFWHAIARRFASQLDAQQSEINDLSLQAGDNLAAIQALQAAVAALQGN